MDLISRVSTKHVTLPVLQCVILEANKDQLLLKVNNLDMAIEVILQAEVEKEGVVAVPVPVFQKTVSLYNQEKISLQLEGTNLVVENNDSVTKINTIPNEEFPKIPKLEEKGQEIQRDLFALGLKTVSFAADPSSIKPEMGSVYIFQKKPQSITFVSTDSFRLMEKTVAQKNLVLTESVMVPCKNTSEIQRILETAESNPVMSVSSNQLSMSFFGGAIYLTSRLIAGSFPDYEQIIPKEQKTEVKLLKHDLLNALKKTDIFLNKRSQVSLSVEEKSLVVSSNSGEGGH